MPAMTSHSAHPFAASRGERAAWLCLALLLVVGFSLATDLSMWFQTWRGNRAGSSDMLAVAMGDARRMFANHFFVKADAYFHSGFYPTIYDNRQSFQTPHIAEDSGAAAQGKNTGDETGFLGAPRNWIDRFGRQFFPSVHTHLTEGGANGEESQAEVGEILPWLKLSAELDPTRVETYTVTAYWLRRMNKIDEAEGFLRDGLRENPGDPELLFDLGSLYLEHKHDPVRARNCWEAALRNFDRCPAEEQKENKLTADHILGSLAKLDQDQHQTDKAIALLERLKSVSPEPASIQSWIDSLKKKAPTPAM